MNYGEKFKELLKTTAKGFGIGLVISVVLTALMGASGVRDFTEIRLFFSNWWI